VFVLPARPTILTGGPACGASASFDAIGSAAAAQHRAVARLTAAPGAPLRPRVLAALEGAVDTIARHGAGEASVAALRSVLVSFRASPDPDDLAYAVALGALAAAAGEARWAIVLVAEDLHAARRADSEALLAAAAAVVGYEPAFAAIVSASHAATVATQVATRRAWADVALRVTTDVFADLVDRVARCHGRRFDDSAIDALVRAGHGAATFVLAHAAVAWESTVEDTITAAQVREAGVGATEHGTADLRRAWTAHLSLGQRRCLRAVAADGSRAVGLDEVARRLGDGTRFGLSGGMLDTVLTSLVQRGLLIVHDGTAELAVPGLAAML
jgi:hypothetical protein